MAETNTANTLLPTIERKLLKMPGHRPIDLRIRLNCYVWMKISYQEPRCSSSAPGFGRLW